MRKSVEIARVKIARRAKAGGGYLMFNGLSSGLQLTLIDMAMVFAVLYTIALVINITRTAIAKTQFKRKDNDSLAKGGTRADITMTTKEGLSAGAQASTGTADDIASHSFSLEVSPTQQDFPPRAAGEITGFVNGDSDKDDSDAKTLTAVISAAVAAYITDQRPKVPVFTSSSAGGAVAAAPAFASPWVMYGRLNQLNRWPRRPARW